MSEAPGKAEVTVEVDATGLSCPLPVIELAKAIGRLEVDDRVRLLATDPAAKIDVPVWCRMQRHDLQGQAQDGQVWRFVVRKAH